MIWTNHYKSGHLDADWVVGIGFRCTNTQHSNIGAARGVAEIPDFLWFSTSSPVSTPGWIEWGDTRFAAKSGPLAIRLPSFFIILFVIFFQINYLYFISFYGTNRTCRQRRAKMSEERFTPRHQRERGAVDFAHRCAWRQWRLRRSDGDIYQLPVEICSIMIIYDYAHRC